MKAREFEGGSPVVHRLAGVRDTSSGQAPLVDHASGLGAEHIGSSESIKHNAAATTNSHPYPFVEVFDCLMLLGPSSSEFS